MVGAHSIGCSRTRSALTLVGNTFYWLQLQDGYFRHCWGVKWVFMVLFASNGVLGALSLRGPFQ
jgi:hypothetical protein